MMAARPARVPTKSYVPKEANAVLESRKYLVVSTQVP